ncbi:hypothetical protein F511_28533 [Dorcoceras hygrometricum]|uniref:Uncharacterized protein n=1 Tax=Dorcoceras hygrometricum TaxID=472368 RepID=A0A2Z7BCK8_9LAMI|nr:hypothetical protein F511_28533 [Dorcoceras hygrometricum]
MDQQMREFRVTSCWFGKTVEEVERRRFVKLKRCVLEPAARGFDANSTATQLQQLAFSDADFIFSTKKLEFLDAKQDGCTGNFTTEIRKDSSCVQGRLRVVTVEFREVMDD